MAGTVKATAHGGLSRTFCEKEVEVSGYLAVVVADSSNLLLTLAATKRLRSGYGAKTCQD